MLVRGKRAYEAEGKGSRTGECLLIGIVIVGAITKDSPKKSQVKESVPHILILREGKWKVSGRLCIV